MAHTLTRLAVLTGYAAHARWSREAGDIIGWIPAFASSPPQPYRFTSTHAIWRWRDRPVAIFETAHRRFEVFAVDGPIYATDDEAYAHARSGDADQIIPGLESVRETEHPLPPVADVPASAFTLTAPEDTAATQLALREE